MMHATYIYGLTDQFGQIRYIGQSERLSARYKEHKKRFKDHGIVGMAILETLSIGADPDLAEIKWIAFFGRDNLLNQTNGGSGAWPSRPLPPESVERKSERSVISTDKWKNSTYRKKASKAIKLALQDPAVKQKQSVARSKFWADEERRAKQSEKLTKHCTDPAARKSRSDAQHKRWSKPGEKERHLERMKKRISDPEYDEQRKRSAERMKQLNADPSFREKSKAGMKNRKPAGDEFRETCSKRMKKLWQDQEFRNRQLSKGLFRKSMQLSAQS